MVEQVQGRRGQLGIHDIDQGQVHAPDGNVARLDLVANGGPNQGLNHPGAEPPRHEMAHYLTRLKYHPAKRKQETTHALKRQRQAAHIKDAAKAIGGWEADRKEIGDSNIGSKGLLGYAAKPLAGSLGANKAPASSRPERAILCGGKEALLERAETLKARLSPELRMVPDANNGQRRETPEEMLHRVGNAAGQLKFAIRELLIVAHAAKDEIAARKDDNLIKPLGQRPPDQNDIEEVSQSLGSAIEELVRLDSAVHRIDEAVAKGKALRAKSWSAAQTQDFLANQLGMCNDDDPNKPLGPVAHTDPRWIQGGIDDIAGHLSNAWTKEPNFVRDLGSRAAVDAAVAAEEMDPDYRHHAVSEALKAHDGAKKGDGDRALFGVAEKTGLLTELEANCRAQTEKSLGKLDRTMRRAKIPGLDPRNRKTRFGRDFAKARQLATKLTFRRNLDEVDRRIRDVSAALDKDLQANRLDTLQNDVDFANEEVARSLHKLDKLTGKVSTLEAEIENLSEQIRQRSGALSENLKQAKRPGAQGGDDSMGHAQAINAMLDQRKILEGALRDVKRAIPEAEAAVASDKRLLAKTRRLVAHQRLEPQKLATELDALQREKKALGEALQTEFRIGADALPSRAKLAGQLDDAMHDVRFAVDRALRSYAGGTFVSTKRKTVADGMRAMLRDVDALIEAQKGDGEFEHIPTGARHSSRATAPELAAMRDQWRLEKKVGDLERELNQSRMKIFRGKLKKTLKTALDDLHLAAGAKVAVKGLRTGIDLHYKATATAAQKAAEAEPLAGQVVGSVYGGVAGVASGVGIAHASQDLHDMKDKAKAGRELVEAHEDALADITDPKARAARKYETGVQRYRGRALQDQKFVQTGVVLSSSIVNAARYAYEAGSMLAEAPMSKAAVTASGAAGAGLGTLTNGVDTLLAAYKSGKGFVDQHTIQKAASKHRTDFDDLCQTVGLDLAPARKLMGGLDLAKAETLIRNSTLGTEDKARMADELRSLAQTEALVRFMKSETKTDEKLALTLYKGTSTAAYGVTLALAVGATAGGLAIAGPILGGAAAVGTIGYYGYKGVKAAKTDYRAMRGADAYLNLADKRIEEKLAKTAKEQGISTDQAALLLIGKKHRDVLAADMLGRLRHEARDAMPNKAERDARAALDAKVEELASRLERLEKRLGKDGVKQVGKLSAGDLAKLAPNDDRAAFGRTSLELANARDELGLLNEALASRVKTASREAQTLSLAHKLPDEVIMSLVEAPESLKADCVGLLSESITKLN